MGSQFFRPHSGFCNLYLDIFQQCGAHRFQLLKRDGAERCIVIGWCTPVNVPMSVGNGSCLRPGFDSGEHKFKSVVRLDSFEIRAVLPQITKERFVIRLNSLSQFPACAWQLVPGTLGSGFDPHKPWLPRGTRPVGALSKDTRITVRRIGPAD